jgi:hypothetical protein
MHLFYKSAAARGYVMSYIFKHVELLLYIYHYLILFLIWSGMATRPKVMGFEAMPDPNVFGRA